MDDVLETLRAGEGPTEEKRKVATERLKESRKIKWRDYEVVVGFVPSEIVLTCSLFAENSSSGIGMGYRYVEVEHNGEKMYRTLVSCRVTKKSGLKAGQLMGELINGGGSNVMGGGGKDGKLTIEEIFNL